MKQLDYSEALDFLINLTSMLHLHHGIRVVVLIDEYDRPVSRSHGTGHAGDVLGMIRKVLSQALKDSDAIQWAVVTGVMQIARESIFSGLNNLKVDNIFSREFDEIFGFTNDEVKAICEHYGHPEKYSEAMEWYDGYLFGSKMISNPWSILRYVESDFEPGTYWANTRGNDIIGSMLDISDETIGSDMTLLAERREINRTISPMVTTGDLNDPKNMFSVMVMSGYLKARLDEGGYRLSIPNMEVYQIIGEMILGRSIDDYDAVKTFFKGMVSGDTAMMKHSLELMFMSSVGFPMLDNEHSYQSFITGMLMYRGGYLVESEKEGGNGRFDTKLTSTRHDLPNVVMEFKKLGSDVSDEKASESARVAIEQIHEKRYYDGLTGDVILYGMSFSGKTVHVASERLLIR